MKKASEILVEAFDVETPHHHGQQGEFPHHNEYIHIALGLM